MRSKRIIGVVYILVSIVVAVQFLVWRLYESNVMWDFANDISLAALFLFNWLNLLVNGASEVGEEVMHDVVWVVVDILIILVSGATGGYLLRGTGE